MIFYKMQGTGNDSIIVDERKELTRFQDLYINGGVERSDIAVHLCKAFGTDGVMFVLKSDHSDAQMRIFNADGSEALMCGNGLRCFGRYVLDDMKRDEIMVETLKADYRVKRVSDFSPYLEGFEILLNNVKAFGHTDAASVLEDKFKSKYNYGYEFFTVSNPHVVTFTGQDIPSDDVLTRIGTFANGVESPFEAGVNVNFCTILGKDKLYVRTFERGVGITKSCGTGMTSSVTRYARKYNRFSTWIEVYNDGGMIHCKVTETDLNAYKVHFVGNASHEFSFELEPEALMTLKHEALKIQWATSEIENYEHFLDWTKKEMHRI